MCAQLETTSSADATMGAVEMIGLYEDAPPVRNTFIHFDVSACGGKRRILRQNQTDPGNVPVPAALPEAPPQTPRSPTVIPTEHKLSRDAQEFIPMSPMSKQSTEDDGVRTPEMLPYDFPNSVASSDEEYQVDDYSWTRRPPVAISLADSITPDRSLRSASPPEWTPNSSADWMPEWTPEPACTWPLPTPPPFPTFGYSPMPTSVPSLQFTQGGLGVRFNFTLLKADGVGVGIDVIPAPEGAGLIVREVLQCGAMEAWNRQAIAGSNAGKAVVPGDRLIRVNDSTDNEDMLTQCREKRLLKMYFARGSVTVEDEAAMEQSQESTQSSQSSQWGLAMNGQMWDQDWRLSAAAA